jgi:hypothetical protein
LFEKCNYADFEIKILFDYKLQRGPGIKHGCKCRHP